MALEGFHKYFKNQSDEEREHAEKVSELQIENLIVCNNLGFYLPKEGLILRSKCYL